MDAMDRLDYYMDMCYAALDDAPVTQAAIDGRAAITYRSEDDKRDF